LLLTLAVIELSDIAFAVGFFSSYFYVQFSFFYFMAPGIGINIYVIQIDSIPAVFGVTRDPLIILSSNIFAISGK
jgi:predicted tellurium resistance membrane protein TerC